MWDRLMYQHWLVQVTNLQIDKVFMITQLKRKVTVELYHCESCCEKAESVYDMLRYRWGSTRHTSNVLSNILTAIKTYGSRG